MIRLLKTTVWLSLVFTAFGLLKPFFKNVKKIFRESYVFHCLVIKVFFVLSLRQLVLFLSHLFFVLSSTFFQVFFQTFFEFKIFVVVFVDDLDTLSYLSVFLSTYFFYFFLKHDFLYQFHKKQFVPNNSDRIASFLFLCQHCFLHNFTFFQKTRFA